MWIAMSQYLTQLDEFITSKVWIFVPVGVVFTTVVLTSVLNIVQRTIRMFVIPHIFQPDLKKYGEWAVVTGATDGIGKAYCKCLAEMGLNIIIISRDPDRLNKTADELVNEYGIKVVSIQADFSRSWDLYDELSELLKGKHIGILVNNVGKAMSVNKRFHEHRIESTIDVIRVNIESALIMTRIVLPQMLKRRNGAIVSVSSLSGQTPVAMLATYGASKAAMTALTRSLHHEYRSNGIDFQCLVPSCVITKIGLIKHNTYLLGKWYFPTPDTYCKSAVRTLGVSNYTSGYFPHSVAFKLTTNPRVSKILMFLFRKYFMDDQLRRG